MKIDLDGNYYPHLYVYLVTYFELEHFFISRPLLNELCHVIFSNLSKHIAKSLKQFSSIVLG
mgnify:FL=1